MCGSERSRQYVAIPRPPPVAIAGVPPAFQEALPDEAEAWRKTLVRLVETGSLV